MSTDWKVRRPSKPKVFAAEPLSRSSSGGTEHTEKMKYRVKQALKSIAAILVISVILIFLTMRGSSNAYHAQKEKVFAMHKWALEELPNKEEGTINPLVEVARNSYGMALRATADIKEHSLIARAPFTKCLSTYSAAMSPIGSIVNIPNFKANLAGVENHDVEKLILNVHLLWELQRGEASSMYPWLRLWPENPSNLQYFNPRELQELQDPFLVESYFVHENAYYDEYLALRPLCFLYPEVFNVHNFTFEAYKRASVLVNTRYFNTQVSIKLPDNPGTQSPSEPLPPRPWYTGEILNVGEVMIPVMDSVNHASLYPYCNEDTEKNIDTFRFDNATKVYSLFTLVPFKAGEEVQWCYNANPNRDLLSEYGFALPLELNQWEVANVQRHPVLGLVPERRDTPDGKLVFSIREQDFLDPAKSAAHATAFASHMCQDNGLQGPQCVAYAENCLTKYLDTFVTTLEEDRKILLNQSALQEIGPYGHHVIQFRITQKELLHKMLAELNRNGSLS